MRILFADGLGDAAVERLRVGGDACTLLPSPTAEDLADHVTWTTPSGRPTVWAPSVTAEDHADHVAGYDVLIVGSTRVTAEASGAVLALPDVIQVSVFKA